MKIKSVKKRNDDDDDDDDESSLACACRPYALPLRSRVHKMDLLLQR